MYFVLLILYSIKYCDGPKSLLISVFPVSGEGPFFPSLMDQTGLARPDLAEEKPAVASGAASDSPRDPATNKYSCGRCGRSYLHQATLVRHQRYECGITASYPCQLCGRKFKRREKIALMLNSK